MLSPSTVPLAHSGSTPLLCGAPAVPGTASCENFAGSFISACSQSPLPSASRPDVDTSTWQVTFDQPMMSPQQVPFTPAAAHGLGFAGLWNGGCKKVTGTSCLCKSGFSSIVKVMSLPLQK